MHRHVAAVLVMLYVVVLVTMHYSIYNMSTGWLVLDEYPKWEAGGPHCPHILQWMFAHAEATEQKGYNCRIWQDCQQSMPEWHPSMETPTANLICYKTTQEEIFLHYTRRSTSWRGPPEQYQVTRGWWKRSTKRPFTHWRSISGIGGVPPSQRNQSENQLAHQGQTYGPISSKECK